MLSNSSVNDRLLDCHLLAESFQRILSLQFFKLDRSVLVEELINRQESSSHSDLDVVLLNLNSNSLGSELIDTFGLSHEHDLQFGPFRIIVDKFSKLLINRIFFDRNVNCYSLFEIDNILLQSFNFNFSIFQLLKKL